MLNIGPQELILVLIIALVVVGPSRLPELGRSVGKALREFRKIQDDVKDTIRFDLHDDTKPNARPRPRTRTASTGVSGNGEPSPSDPPPAVPPTDTSSVDHSTGTPAEPDTEAEPRAAE